MNKDTNYDKMIKQKLKTYCVSQCLEDGVFFTERLVDHVVKKYPLDAICDLQDQLTDKHITSLIKSRPSAVEQYLKDKLNPKQLKQLQKKLEVIK